MYILFCSHYVYNSTCRLDINSSSTKKIDSCPQLKLISDPSPLCSYLMKLSHHSENHSHLRAFFTNIQLDDIKSLGFILVSVCLLFQILHRAQNTRHIGGHQDIFISYLDFSCIIQFQKSTTTSKNSLYYSLRIQQIFVECQLEDKNLYPLEITLF